jgi:hypothetical protein
VAESGVPRAEIFVTTKLPQAHAGRERETLAESLASLGFDYVDLWLIHWPPGGQARPDVWKRLLELQADGLAREVGVSNYSLEQIDELQRATGRLPAVNQIEWSPALFDRDMLEGHRRRGVQLEGYSPLRTMNLRDPGLGEIAEEHGVTPPGSSSGGTSSMGSSPSRSRRTHSASPRTPRFSTFSCTSEVETSMRSAGLDMCTNDSEGPRSRVRPPRPRAATPSARRLPSPRQRAPRWRVPSSVVEVSGLRMHVREGGTGDPVLLLHGLGVGAPWHACARSRSDASDRSGSARLGAQRATGAAAGVGAADVLAELLDRSGRRSADRRELLGARWRSCSRSAVSDLVGPLVLLGPTVDPRYRSWVHAVRLALDATREPPALWRILIGDYARMA